MAEPILLAKSGSALLGLLPAMANRHGCITGATGTGKTVTLQRLAEGFSRLGSAVFVADIKGDLSGLAAPGAPSPKLDARLQQLGLPPPAWQACPVTFWDLFGKQGHPLRATVADVGPRLLSRLLSLNETQEGVLAIVFKVADEAGLPLLDMKDLRAMIQWVTDNAEAVRPRYGNVTAASVGAITRALLQLEEEGAEQFFGEPMLDVHHLLATRDGHGVVNVLAADALMSRPRVYSTFLLWLLSELYETLPEVGDVEVPKLVFFFDEAHLLFAEASSALLEKVSQVVRLIRSKGVGVWFVTQNPLDIPDVVLSQLGNRVQHALRAFTPRDQKAVTAAAQTMRPNPQLDLARVIGELGVGEALVSVLDAQGVPGVTERAFIVPPGSRIGPISPEQRAEVLAGSMVKGLYDTPVDRESAFELLTQRAQGRAPTSAPAAPPAAPPVATPVSAPGLAGYTSGAAAVAGGVTGFAAGGGLTGFTPGAGSTGGGLPGFASGAPAPVPTAGWPTTAPAAPASAGGGLSDLIFGATGPRGGHREGMVEVMAKSAARSVGSSVARELTRGVLGSLLGGRRR